MTSNAGANTSYGFRWNSTFDPDYSSAGHQPLYRDTYATIYDHYAVVSARMKVRIISLTSSVAILANCVTDDDTTLSTTFDTLCEQSHGFTQLMGGATGGKNYIEFDLAWDCKTILGIDPYTSQSYKTAVASNPSEESLLWITVKALGSATAQVQVSIILEQDVLWTELSTPTQS